MAKKAVVQNLEPSTEATVENLEANPAPEPVEAAALPSLETLLNLLGVALDEFLRRLEVLQSHNPQVPLEAEQVASVLRSLVTRDKLTAAFLKAGQLALQTIKDGHGENASDPSASS